MEPGGSNPTGGASLTPSEPTPLPRWSELKEGEQVAEITKASRFERWSKLLISLGLQITQSRSSLHAVGPKVGIIDIFAHLRYIERDRER